MAIQTKNNMPTFVDTKYDNLKKALDDKKVTPPIFGFLNDLECMVYVSPSGAIYKILVDKVSMMEKQLEGLIGASGEELTVKEYVDNNITPVTETVNEIKKSGATILITSDMLDNTDGEVPDDGI